jgi:hypothetical protein
MFFYGSLTDSDVLRTILALPSPPSLHSAKVSGYAPKMWSIYPALIPSDIASQQAGMLWHCVSEHHFKALEAYETGRIRGRSAMRRSTMARCCGVCEFLCGLVMRRLCSWTRAVSIWSGIGTFSRGAFLEIGR